MPEGKTKSANTVRTATPLIRNVLDYLKAVIKHWAALLTGGFLAACLAAWQGFGHSVSHWFYWVFSIGAVMVATYKAWLEERDKVITLEGSATDQNVISIASASATQNANPITIQHTVVNPFPPPPHESPKLIEDRPKANVKFLGHKVTRVTLVDGEDGKVYEEDERGNKALVFNFRNDPIPEIPVSPFWEAIAHIRFFDKNDYEVGSIPSAMWLRSIKERVTLHVGENKAVVVAIQTESGWLSKSVKLVPKGNYWGSYNEQQITDLILSSDATRAEVTLINNKSVATKSYAASMNLEYAIFGPLDREH